MCGLPLAPLPWLSMWEMSLEEREEKETWERTRWTWENASCDRVGERTAFWVRDMEHLPHIVTDHAVRRDNMYHQGDTGQGDKAYRSIGDDCNDSFLVNAYSILDIPVHVADKNRQVPIIMETSDSEANDEEMDDYYENHKAWPTSSS